MVFTVVELSQLHSANAVEAAQLGLDVSRQMLGKHILRQLCEKIIVGVFNEFTQITGQLHGPQVKIVKCLEIFCIVLAVISELRAHILMNSKLINVENEFRNDLIGTREDLLDDCVVLMTKW